MRLLSLCTLLCCGGSPARPQLVLDPDDLTHHHRRKDNRREVLEDVLAGSLAFGGRLCRVRENLRQVQGWGSPNAAGDTHVLMMCIECQGHFAGCCIRWPQRRSNSEAVAAVILLGGLVWWMFFQS